MVYSSFQAWVDATRNRFWDLDGAYGAQCWDLWAKYCVDCYGLTVAQCITPSGYAEGIYNRYPTSTAVGDTFERLGADATPKREDVAVWNFSSAYPSSHIAIVLEDGTSGGTIRVLTQNPDASADKRLSVSGLAGYLRPKHPLSDGSGGGGGGGGGDTPSPSEPEAVGSFMQRYDNQILLTGSKDGKKSVRTFLRGTTMWKETPSTLSGWIEPSGDTMLLHEGRNGSYRVRTFWKIGDGQWRGKAITDISSGGQSQPGSSDSSENSYALYVVGTVESSLRWDAVEAANLQGIGIAQWSFGRRLQVLNKMKTADPTGWNTFKTKAPAVAALVESGGTFTRNLTQTEADAFKAWASRSESHQGQRDQFTEDYKGYPQTYEDDKMQILWVTAYHQSPAGAQNVPKASTLLELRNNILNTSPFGPYTSRYYTAYNLLNSWDGKSNPPNF